MEFYATLGWNSCADRATLDGLFAAGMTGARLNLSTPPPPPVRPPAGGYLLACRPRLRPGRPSHHRPARPGAAGGYPHCSRCTGVRGAGPCLAPAASPFPPPPWRLPSRETASPWTTAPCWYRWRKKRPDCLFLPGRAGRAAPKPQEPGHLGREVHTPTLTQADLDNLAQAKRFGVTHILQPLSGARRMSTPRAGPWLRPSWNTGRSWRKLKTSGAGEAGRDHRFLPTSSDCPGRPGQQHAPVAAALPPKSTLPAPAASAGKPFL